MYEAMDGGRVNARSQRMPAHGPGGQTESWLMAKVSVLVAVSRSAASRAPPCCPAHARPSNGRLLLPFFHHYTLMVA